MSVQVKKRIDWKSVDGASEFPRQLHLEKATNQRYYCPVIILRSLRIWKPEGMPKTRQDKAWMVFVF